MSTNFLKVPLFNLPMPKMSITLIFTHLLFVNCIFLNIAVSKRAHLFKFGGLKNQVIILLLSYESDSDKEKNGEKKF